MRCCLAAMLVRAVVIDLLTLFVGVAHEEAAGFKKVSDTGRVRGLRSKAEAIATQNSPQQKRTTKVCTRASIVLQMRTHTHTHTHTHTTHTHTHTCTRTCATRGSRVRATKHPSKLSLTQRS